MQYTTRLGSAPTRAHVNYECPCGCTGGVIYNSEKPLSKAGACCCGRKLWVGRDAETRLKPSLDEGVNYDWDVGTVTLPWGEVAEAAMAWPKDSVSPRGQDHHAGHDHDQERVDEMQTSEHRVKDPVCGMMIDPAIAAATSSLQGTTFYFCAVGCKTRFDANPKQYVQARGLLDRLRGR